MNDFQRFLEAQRQRGQAPASGPGAFLTRAVGAVAAVGLLTLSLVFGAFVLTALLAVGLVGAVGLRIWLWWQRRRFVGQPPTGASRRQPRTGASQAGDGDVVEGEFEVLDDQDARRRNDER
ncbi:MAG: hypothetical protein AAFX85_17220 [Pseudomonadota bacterium]